MAYLPIKDRIMFDWSKLEIPPEYSKPTYIVADCMVEVFREILGDRANVIPISDTYLPDKEKPYELQAIDEN